MNISELQLQGGIVNSLLIVVPVVIASVLAFLLGRHAEAQKYSPKRAEKFILNFLADGKEHGAATIKLAAAEAGISGEPYTEACFNLRANRVEGITRDGIPYIRLAA
jgi:hypothetical protein